MQAASAPVSLHRPLPPEEAGRADLYALLAALLRSGPDATLLASIARAEPLPAGGDAALASAWQGLIDASRAMDEEAAEDEYEALFVGVGKAEVSIYAGYYTGALAIDHPRVRLQADLASFGLARREGVSEPEDHFAGIFDVMRVLVAGGAGRASAPIEDQARFFETYLKTGAVRFFQALARAEKANYYRKVAALGLAFMALEIEAFQLD